LPFLEYQMLFPFQQEVPIPVQCSLT